MRRQVLTEAQWARLRPLLPNQVTAPKASRGCSVGHMGDRLFVEAVLFRARTGAPGRDLPERFGPRKSVYKSIFKLGAEGALGGDGVRLPDVTNDERGPLVPDQDPQPRHGHSENSVEGHVAPTTEATGATVVCWLGRAAAWFRPEAHAQSPEPFPQIQAGT